MVALVVIPEKMENLVVVVVVGVVVLRMQQWAVQVEVVVFLLPLLQNQPLVLIMIGPTINRALRVEQQMSPKTKLKLQLVNIA
ncbi:MAG: hypothetical protein EBY29_16845 [Planctomycetes bacterium]|nr:hypothetical protein [Planctomycetota bacterium]